MSMDMGLFCYNESVMKWAISQKSRLHYNTLKAFLQVTPSTFDLTNFIYSTTSQGQPLTVIM